jgi:hypothetical protein
MRSWPTLLSLVILEVPATTSASAADPLACKIKSCLVLHGFNQSHRLGRIGLASEKRPVADEGLNSIIESVFLQRPFSLLEKAIDVKRQHYGNLGIDAFHGNAVGFPENLLRRLDEGRLIAQAVHIVILNTGEFDSFPFVVITNGRWALL